MVDLDFLPTFLDEASETLELWESSCLKLENDQSPEILNALFRSAHNIKGSSRSVGLEMFGSLVHQAEDLITSLKTGNIAVTAAVVAALLECQKVLTEWVDHLRSNPEFCPDTKNILATLRSFDNKSVAKTIPTDSGFGFFDDVPNPPLSSVASNPKDIGTILVESGKVTQEQIEQAVKQQHRKLGEVLVDEGIVTTDAIKTALEDQKSQGHKPDETIRVSLRKLDSVVRLIGELSIQHAIVRNARDTNTFNEGAASEAINLAHKVIQDLQSEAMALRMQPLENLFQRMERVSRDVARQQNKSIQVSLKGSDVELDKTVIEKMKDPLVHILRNAVDHGIEPIENRQAKGKPPIATITIEGSQTASNVTIKISDDGSGLNEQRILQKAREKGLIKADASPTAQEIHQMIFLPGFSTAEKVTDISGRGVGMDVVKRSVDELGGSIAIESSPGKGTQFLITLPSTLSILDAVVVGLNGALYAIPIQDVDEVVDMSCTPIETSTQTGRLINLRGQVLPLERLSSFLPSRQEIEQSHPGVAIIARHKSATVAFQVDKVAGQQSIVVRQLEGNLAAVAGFSGGTILANGEPSMIIHLPQIVKSYLTEIK